MTGSYLQNRWFAFALLGLFLFGSTLYAQKFKVRVAFPNLQFIEPVDMQSPRDNSSFLYVAERRGVIRFFVNTEFVDTSHVFLDISNRVASDGGEQGLIGLAFDPEFAGNGFFYVHYTMNNPWRTVLSRFRVDPTNPPYADPNSERILLQINRKTDYHNGGQLAFGPDGYLYIGVGEGGQEYLAPALTSLLGKILRIDVRSTPPQGKKYAIPQDNPYRGNAFDYREEIYAYGLRNPWRFSIDPVTNRLWAGDVGPENWEELNIIRKGMNYGWPRMEGSHCYPPKDSGCDQTALELPVWEYSHGQGVAIMGGHVYRGPRLSELVGEYICGDFGMGIIWGIRYDADSLICRVLIDAGPTITSFGLDADNELYFTSFDGRIYIIDRAITIDTSEQTVDVATSLVASSIGYLTSSPNPFVTSTTIRYQLLRRGHIRLEVRNLLGGVVARLVDEVQEQGDHRVDFDGAGLAPGVYCYTITENDGMTHVGRMVMVK